VCPTLDLERGSHRAADPFRQRTLDIAGESTMQGFRRDTVTDFNGCDVCREVGKSGVSQPFERGRWHNLLKLSQNRAPQ